jgi:hypothetical protein
VKNKIVEMGNGIYLFVSAEQKETEKRKAWEEELNKRYKEFYGVERDA